MTDTLTEIDPEALRRGLVRLFAEPKSLHHIVAVGLDGVRRHLAQLCEAIEGAENGADEVVTTVAELANLVRQEQRKHKGAVAQAKKEHARAEQLAAEVERLGKRVGDWRQAVGSGIRGREEARIERDEARGLHRQELELRANAEQQLRDALAENERLRSELADYQLAASEQQGAAQREAPIPPCFCGHPQPDHDLVPSQPGILARPDTWACFGCTGNGLGFIGLHAYKPKPDKPLLPQQREPVGGDRVRVTVEGDLVIDPRGFGQYTLAFRPGPNGTQIGYMGIRRTRPSPFSAPTSPLPSSPPPTASPTSAPKPWSSSARRRPKTRRMSTACSSA